MPDKELIEKIISAHLTWRQNLLKLAYSGENNGWTNRNIAGDPTACEMGKILSKVNVSNHPLWKEIDQTHKLFHIEAEKIFILAEAGKQKEVEHLLNPVNGDFIELTSRLTSLLRQAAHQISDKE